MELKAIKNAKRITIVGTPGSGKSFLAKIIGQRFDIPIFHMDLHFRKIKDLSIVYHALEKETREQKWIIDGNYPSHLESLRLRLERADLVLYLNFDFDFCIDSVRKRYHSGEKSPNGIETEETLENLVDMIKTKYPTANENVKQYINEYARNKTIEFNNREQVEKFIENL